ncbi:MAG: hypothetical protein AB7E96_06800 [Deferribacterales bacterium]
MENLTELQTEAMGELFNIAYGLATSLISDSIGMHSSMYVPEMEIIDIENLADTIAGVIDEDKEYYHVSQVFLNYLEGETVMLMSRESAAALTECYSRIDDMLDDSSEEDIKSCTLEISNIITSALIGRIADLTNTEIFFQPPEIKPYKTSEIHDLRRGSEFSQVIVIKVIIDIDSTEIKGHMYVLLKEQSFSRFKEALDYFIDHYAG